MCNEINLLICPLVSSDAPRAIRCIQSAYNQRNYSINFEVHLVINSIDSAFVKDMVRYCDKNNVKYVVTESDGTPSTGKNSVFEYFMTTNFTHLTQLDGDDFFYPTFLQHVERHLRKYPNTDVMSTCPCDSIFHKNGGNDAQLTSGNYGCLWGINYVDYRSNMVFGKDPLVDGISNPNYARLVLFSKKASEKYRYDPEVIVGEDLKIHYDYLWAHQNDELSYWFSSASDMWVRDGTSFGMQKKASNTVVNGDYVITRRDDMFYKVRDHVLGMMVHDRTGPGEIPIDFAPLYLGYQEKIDFLNEFEKKYVNSVL